MSMKSQSIWEIKKSMLSQCQAQIQLHATYCSTQADQKLIIRRISLLFSEFNGREGGDRKNSFLILLL